MLVRIAKFQVNYFNIACSIFCITMYSSSLNPLIPNQPSNIPAYNCNYSDY